MHFNQCYVKKATWQLIKKQLSSLLSQFHQKWFKVFIIGRHYYGNLSFLTCSCYLINKFYKKQFTWIILNHISSRRFNRFRQVCNIIGCMAITRSRNELTCAVLNWTWALSIYELCSKLKGCRGINNKTKPINNKLTSFKL
jgi:hypothetical protein